MKTMNTHKQSAIKTPVAGKQYSYSEVVEFLDKHFASDLQDVSLSNIKQLDKAFGNLSQKVPSIIITGTNGKSLTAHYLMHLLKEEGLTVGTLYAPHILTYNERLVLNNEIISNKSFTDIANEVLTMAASLEITPHALDVLTMMALVYFSKSNADVIVLEASDTSAANPVNLCKPLITAITRITNFDDTEKGKAALEKEIKQILSIVKADAHVVSADQSKLNLQIMQDVTDAHKGVWAMPIRKLAPLPYPFEQLHGRCAALAERVAQIFVNSIQKDAVIVANSLLTKQKGQRGRPTLEAKRNAELNPKRTVEQFWKATAHSLPGRFQLLEKEKPTILLDSASNLDALENVLLGIRLLHYHHPLKGLTLILGSDNSALDLTEFLKLLRYFFKKTSGQVIVCPVQPQMSSATTESWDAEKVTNEIKNMKIKAKSAKNFKEAFESAQKSVDERHGLVVVTGSPAIVTEYWRLKGMKKL